MEKLLFILILSLISQGCSAVRKVTGRGPASASDDSLSNESLVRIPRDCILADSKDTSSQPPMSLYYASSGSWVSSNQPVERLAPRFVVIKAACEKLLQENSNAIAEKYFIDKTKSVPFLPYTASSKRPYCGMKVTEQSCTATTVAHPSYIFDVNQGTFPQDVGPTIEPIAAAISKGRKLDLSRLDPNHTIVAVAFSKQPRTKFVLHFVNDQTNVLEARGDVRFIILGRQESSVRNEKKVKSHKDDFEVIDEFYSKNVDLTERPDFGRFLKVQAKLWDADHSVKKWRIFREGKYGEVLAQEIMKRARLLALVWRSSSVADSDYLSTSQKLGVIDAFADAVAQKAFADVTESDWIKFSLDELIPELTQAAIQYASLYLSKSEDPEFITSAAAIWWAARTVQLSAGCNLSTETPIREDLVTIQFDHQNCRRSYTGRAYVALNRSIALSGTVPTESPYWAIAIALGSRVERVRLFNVAIDDALKRLDGNQTANSSEFFQFLWQLIGTEYELKRKQVLTWNGFQPASASDIETLEMHLENLKRYFKKVAETAHKNRWTDPELVRATETLRNTWNELYPGKTHEIVGPELSGSIEEELQGLSAGLKKVDDKKDIGKLLEMSNLLLEKYDEKTLETCQPWFEYLNNEKNRKLFLDMLSDKTRPPTTISNCLGVLPYWAALPIRHSVKTSDFQQTCSFSSDFRPRGLACISLALLFQEHSPDRANWLVKGLLEQNLPAHLHSQAYDRFSTELEEVIKHKKFSRKTKLAWLAAASDLAEGISRELSAWFTEIPDWKAFSNCYDSEQLGDSLDKQRFSFSLSRVRIDRSCEINEGIAKKWFMRFIKIRGAFYDEVSPWKKPTQFSDYGSVYCSMEWRFNSVKAITNSLGKRPKKNDIAKYLKSLKPYYESAGSSGARMIERMLNKKDFCPF